MLSPDEILKNSYHADVNELREFVYTEYLQLLILKYINEVKLKKSYYLFGAYLNRLFFDRSKFGNTLDFLTDNNSVTDFNLLNEQIKLMLKLDGYEVNILKKTKYQFTFEITVPKQLDSGTNNNNTYTINLIYYPVSNYFKPALFKTITAFMHVKGYDVNFHIRVIRTEYSLSTLLRIVLVRKTIEPIELYDIYRLTTTHWQQVDHKFFTSNELKNLIKTVTKVKQKLTTQKIKAVNNKSFYVIEKNKIKEFFDFNNWITMLKI